MKCPSCAEEVVDSTATCPHCDRPLSMGVGDPMRGSDLVLHGKQGKTLIVAGDTLKIEKTGFLTGKREKTILIRTVTSVEVKKPGGFVGFIQFSIAGGASRDSSYTVTGGALDAVKDENSVVFNGSENYEIALKIKAYVEAWSPLEQSSVRPQSGAGDIPNQIRSLKALMDEGLLTPEEFAQKKKQLLGL